MRETEGDAVPFTPVWGDSSLGEPVCEKWMGAL